MQTRVEPLSDLGKGSAIHKRLHYYLSQLALTRIDSSVPIAISREQQTATIDLGSSRVQYHRSVFVTVNFAWTKAGIS